MARAWFTLGLAGMSALWVPGANAETHRSPFAPPESAGAPASQAGPNAIELRGLMATAEGTKYNIYDPAKRTSVWVGLNEPGYGFMIRSADSKVDQVTVESNGQQMTLAMKEAKVASAGGGGLPPGGVVLRPTSADEAVRLQAVAEEVRRRRMLREQAAVQQGQGPALYPQGGPYVRGNRPQQ